MDAVFIDVDNTLGNTTAHYMRTYNKMFDAEVPVYSNPGRYNRQSFPEFTSYITNGFVKDEAERMYKIFNTKSFWKNIPIFPFAADAVRELSEKYNVYLLTAPSFKSPHFFNARLEWVRKNLPLFDYHNIIFSEHKNLFMKNSILIDDMPKNLEKFRGRTIKINYHFNYSTPTAAAFDWNEWAKVPAIVNQLAKQK